MITIDRHVAVHVLGLSAVVAFGLVAIYTFINFVTDIDDIGQGDFGIWQLVVYTGMLTPAVLYTLMPLIAMMGTLMGLGSLASQGELTAMRAAGLSIFRIGGAAMYAGLVLGLLSVALGDFLAPMGTQRAETYKSVARYGIASEIGGRPIWLREGEHYFLIRRLISKSHVADVDVFVVDGDSGLRAALRVDDARYDGQQWIFEGVDRTLFGPGGVRAERIDQMTWRGGLSPEVLHLFVLKANTLTAPGLWRLIRYLDENGLDASQYQMSLWRKLVAPFTVAAMMLLAVPFVFGALRDAGAGQRLLVGILIGVGFYVVNEVCASLGQLYGWPAAIAASAPTMALSALAVFRLRAAG
jgi:lipopolysaccharide export system permease protein